MSSPAANFDVAQAKPKKFEEASSSALPLSPAIARRHGASRRSIPGNRIDVALLIMDYVVLSMGAIIGHHPWVLLKSAIFVLLLELGGFYRRRLTLSALNDLPRLIVMTFLGTVVTITITNTETDVRSMILGFLGIVGALFLIRLAYYGFTRRRRRRKISARSRTAIVGGGAIAAKIVEIIYEHPELGLEPVVVLERDPLPNVCMRGVAVDRARGSLCEALVENNISTAIMAFSNTPDSRFVSPLRECDELHCEIYVVPRLFEFIQLSPEMDRLHTIPLLRARRYSRRTWYWRIKRIFDATVAAMALLLLSPFLACAAAAIRLNTPSAPIFFKQTRIGRGGREFELYKFRSMKPIDRTVSDSHWRPDHSARLDTLGRFLRASSIDELPQLWNVLRGDMSLVGPRPERPHFVEQFGSAVQSYSDRHRVDVGLTGWAAIHGLRGDTSIADRAMYDNFYIENWSIWLDLKIIILTIGAVLKGTKS